MIITAYGRMSIEHNTYKLLKEASMNHILISITSNIKHAVDLQYVKKCSYCKEILTNYFEDMDTIDYKSLEKDGISNRYILFNEKHALDILNFVEKNINNISSIIVHCDAGVSRSVGTAAALSKILNGYDDTYFKGSPNRHVYSTILKTYYDNHNKFPNMEKYYWKSRETDDIL